MRNYIFGHTSLETAKEVKDYPYGFRLRTEIYYWIETVAKKGDRFCTCTRNPKNGRMNAPKKSTFSNIMALYVNSENGHIHVSSLGIYAKPEERELFIQVVGINNLLPEQMKQWNQLNGVIVKDKDKITGDDLKDYSIKWEKHSDGTLYELKITFDRPDGISLKEIFHAIKSVNQDRLKQVFADRESKWHASGYCHGFVRICVRGGVQITSVQRETYQEWMASDFAAVEAEA